MLEGLIINFVNFHSFYVGRYVFRLSNGERFYYRLFKQYLLLVLLNQMGTALYRCIAAIGRTLVVANKCGSFALLILFALGGFVLSRGKNCNLNFLTGLSVWLLVGHFN